jgi:GxxExxY protein
MSGFTRAELRGHAVAVMQQLGKGHRERVYHRAMITSLNQAGVQHRSEVPAPLYCMGEVVGVGRCDLVIGSLVVEIKANAQPPRCALSQLRKYTQNLGRAERRRYRGVIVNFNQNTGAVQTLLVGNSK